MATPSPAWPFASAEAGPPPLPAPASLTGSNKSLGNQAPKKPPPAGTAATSLPGAAVDSESEWLAPVYTAPNPRWTPEARASWLSARTDERGGAVVQPSTVDAGAATAELVLDRLAQDGAVIISGLVSPAVCAEVVAQIAAGGAQRGDGCLALASTAAHELLAHPLVSEVCDAVLACQALRMPEAELSERLVLGGSFTSQRPLRQLAWEIDYARCDGVNEIGLFAPFIHRNDPFTKTGSGQT